MEFITNRQYQPTSLEFFERTFFEYMIQNCQDDFHNILADSRRNNHFAIQISYIDLNVFNSGICDGLLHKPKEMLLCGDKAAMSAMSHIYENMDDKRNQCIKKSCHVRIHGMPACWDRFMTSFPGVEELGKFITLVGTVIRVKRSKLLECSKIYKCDKCGESLPVPSESSRYHTFPASIDKCPNLCEGAKLRALANDSIEKMRDYQEISLQERYDSTHEGLLQTVSVVLENDIVDSCKPGDDIIVSGYFFLRWQNFRPTRDLNPEFTFIANHITIINDQKTNIAYNNELLQFYHDFWRKYTDNPFHGRNIIVKSFFKQVHGMYLLKLATCVILAGGVATTKSRGDSHILIVGDPGTAKSQLLAYVSRLMPRSLLTTGGGTTAAGLTVAAIKEGNDWQLEAGSLVLADGGVCCIDEFSQIKEQDLTSIHEAMEQQTISIAKAGIVCSLNTKCTVIAAMNPKVNGHIRNQSSIGLASPLLSRFDLVMQLKDIVNEEWDNFVADNLLNDAMGIVASECTEIWDDDKLKAYLVYVKGKKPQMTDNARIILERYYQFQRNHYYRDVARTTLRLFESLIRISEGHAKLMFRESVLIQDAIIAVILTEYSMDIPSLMNTTNIMHVSFPSDPKQEYYMHARSALCALGLDELWDHEKNYLECLSVRDDIQPQNNNTYDAFEEILPDDLTQFFSN